MQCGKLSQGTVEEGKAPRPGGWARLPLLVADWPSAGPWKMFAGLTFRLLEMQALSMGWWEGDSALLGGKSFIKEQEMNDNLTSSGRFFHQLEHSVFG